MIVLEVAQVVAQVAVPEATTNGATYRLLLALIRSAATALRIFSKKSATFR